MNRTILVTGGGKGIGGAISRHLARDGFTVVIHYHRDHQTAQEMVDAIQGGGGSGRLLTFDLGDREACRAALAQDLTDHGPYYGVVLNAGVHQDNPFPAMTAAEWDGVLGPNLDGFYNVLHPVIMPMIMAHEGGRIVTLSSISGIAGNRGQVNYSAAKAGIIGATKALAIELAKRRITVNCVAPGVIATQMVAELPLEEMIKQIPMRRLGQPEEVAALVGFLCSDAAAYITRQVISVNGGIL